MSASRSAAPDLHPEILRRDGRPQFAVLPYEEFLALQQRLEDLEDLGNGMGVSDPVSGDAVVKLRASQPARKKAHGRKRKSAKRKKRR